VDWEKPQLPNNSVFLFNLGESRPIDFSYVFKKADDATVQKLEVVTAARGDFFSALTSGDSESAITTAEIYMPHLFGLIEEAKNLPDDCPIPRLKISWTSSLGSKYSKKFFTSNHWHFEAVNAILQYGLLHREKAHIMLKSLVSNDDFINQTVPIAKTLCFAAGIFDYIKNVELARWTQKPVELLPEKYTELYTILSTLCIAEAHQIAVKKGYLSGMGLSAVAKLCMDVHGKFRYISNVLQSPGFCDTFVMPQFVSYCAFNDHLYEMFAFTLLGVHSSQKAEYGKSVAYLQLAIQRGSNFDKIPGDKTSDTSRMRNHYEEQLKLASLFHAKYEKDNMRIYYESVPQAAQLEMPAAHQILQPLEWSPPTAIPINIALQESSSCALM